MRLYFWKNRFILDLNQVENRLLWSWQQQTTQKSLGTNLESLLFLFSVCHQRSSQCGMITWPVESVAWLILHLATSLQRDLIFYWRALFLPLQDSLRLLLLSALLLWLSIISVRSVVFIPAHLGASPSLLQKRIRDRSRSHNPWTSFCL